MNGSLLMAVLLLSPTEVEVQRGETLSQVAERMLGSSTGASELKALNGLKDDTVAPGTRLKLPGPSRDLAQTALTSARNSMAQADAQAPRHEEALAKLKEAEAHFQSARYEEAAQAADGVWKLLAARPTQPTKLSVTVDDKGATTVRAVSGRVAVEGNGVTRVLEDGGSLQVDKGQAPRALLAAPQPTRPTDKQKLSQKAAKKGLEPVLISWQGVTGAQGYEVEVVPEQGDKLVLSVTEPQLKVSLAAGAYRWSVRALTQNERSDASVAQVFEVAQAPTKSMNVKVKPTKWK